MKKKNETPQVEGQEKLVDRILSIKEEIDKLKSEYAPLETKAKEFGEEYLKKELKKNFGSLNLLGSSGVAAQIQVKHPTVRIFNGNVEEAEKILGKDLYLFFELDISPEETVLASRISELKELIVKAGKDPSEFIRHERTLAAKEQWLDPDLRERLLGKNTKKISEKIEAIAKGKDNGIALKAVIVKE